MGAETSSERALRLLEPHTGALEVLDRDLRLDGVMRADFVAIDSERRLVLGLVAESGGEDLFFAAVAALTFAREHGRALAQHFAASGVRPELAPLVVVVAIVLEPRTRARLAALDRTAVRCFELCSFESRSGRSDVLVPLAEFARPSSAPKAAPPAGVPVAQRLAERLARLDGEVASRLDGRNAAWTWRGHELCTACGDDGRWSGTIPGTSQRFALEDDGGLDPFLDAVVRRYLAVAAPAAEGDGAAAAPR